MNSDHLYSHFFKNNEEQVFQYLYDLVNINSQTSNSIGVNKVGQKCIDIFSLLGFSSEVIPSELENPLGDYVFLTHKGKEDKNIILVSHLDTVYSPEEEHENNFFWREEKDKIYGPGVCDIKGGTVLIYFVLKALKEIHRDIFEKYTWHILLNAREEEGTNEFFSLAQKFIDKNTLAVLVYEAGGIETEGSSIVHARKGVARFFMETWGRQAHSGIDHMKGANAILELAHKIIEIENKTDHAKGLTFNIGKVAGGVAINRVPDYANCYVDIRTTTPQDFEYAVNFMNQLKQQNNVKSLADGFVCQTKLDQMPSYPCWPENEMSNMLRGLFISCAHDIGLSLSSKHRSGASDGSFFWHLLPTIDGLGPLGANDHCSIHNEAEGKEQEFIIKSSLCERTYLNIVSILKILQMEESFLLRTS